MIRLLLKKQSGLGLSCLSKLLWQATTYRMVIGWHQSVFHCCLFAFSKKHFSNVSRPIMIKFHEKHYQVVIALDQADWIGTWFAIAI